MLKNYFEKHFGVTLHKSTNKKYDWYVSDRKAQEKFREYGISENYGKEKEIPEAIMLGPKEYQVAFLRGLFDTDAFCNVKYSVVEIGSFSAKLINQLQILLLNLGVVNKVRKKKTKQFGPCYYLEIPGEANECFAKEVGFGIAEKQRRLNKILSKLKNTNVNLVPYQQERLSSLFNYLKLKSKNLEQAFCHTSVKQLYRCLRRTRNLSKQALDKILELFAKNCPSIKKLPEYNYLSELGDNRFFFSPIKEIKKGRKEKVYDFTVPKYHSFVANGLINHNTMLARAVASEAGVPFFSIVGSAFIELFVGVGSSRVRNLFETAKKQAPSLIFIDELESIGKIRMPGIGGGHEEREQTLNQILAEMDGFERETGVIVLAASNRPEMLDPALLRPGRFDRRIVLDLPDVKGREQILKIHCRDKPLALDVNLKEVAERTPGFSGADLANLVNEAAILAARRDKRQIYQEEFLESIEKVLLGPERKSHLLSQKEKEISAFHEAGHALVSSTIPEAEEVRKISIVSRGMAAGYTLALPKEEKRIKTKSEFLAELAVLLAGFCAEKIKFGQISTGAANDLQKASILARSLVTKFGMSKLGPVSFGKREALPFLGWEQETERNYSEKVASAIDKETERFVKQAQRKAKDVLTKKRSTLEKIAKILIEKETIEKEEFDKLVKSGIKRASPKRKARK